MLGGLHISRSFQIPSKYFQLEIRGKQLLFSNTCLQMKGTKVHWPPEVTRTFSDAIGYVNINGGRFADLLEADAQTKARVVTFTMR